MSKHSKFSPSCAERWLACPGSLAFPPTGDEGSRYAAEGTAAHRLAHRCWLLDRDPEKFLGEEIDGYTITDEMVEAVQVYLDTIDAKYQALPGSRKEIELEKRIDHGELADFGGTIDCLIRSDAAFAIVDFKYGAGVAVEVEGNAQLSCYALLALSLDDTLRPAGLTIVQPRAHHHDGPVRSWDCGAEYLTKFRARIEYATLDVDDGEAQLHAGDHCRWCPAKVDCPTLYGLTIESARREFDESGMSPERAAEVLANAAALRSYLSAVEDWVHGRLDKGESVPGYKLVNAYGNRRFSLSEEDVVRLCRNKKFGKKLIYETKLLSPAQLEKVVGKELVGQMTERPLKGTTVVPESDKRPAVVRQSAQEEFSSEKVA